MRKAAGMAATGHPIEIISEADFYRMLAVCGENKSADGNVRWRRAKREPRGCSMTLAISSLDCREHCTMVVAGTGPPGQARPALTATRSNLPCRS